MGFEASYACSSGSVFLACWGFNYARGRLADRMELDPTDIRAEEVVALARVYARNANQAYEEAGYSTAASRTPLDFTALNASLDRLFAHRAIPGDPIRGETIPLKPLRSSLLLSYLGISGIYIPFTGEPSVNAHQPAPSLPYVAAHEKAHQRGITNEGEASFAAFLVTTSDEAPPHVRYSGYLMSASRLMSEASRYLGKNDLETAWAVFDPGPLEDLRMIREYWLGFEGPASEATHEVNHRYLESMRVPGGAQSYDEVVQLLVAWERAHGGTPLADPN